MFSTEFTVALEEINAGSRGFICVGRFAKKTGDDAETMKSLASAAGFSVIRHGRYGYCIEKGA